MPRRRELVIENFRLGQRFDGALRDDRLESARSLKNFDIIYTDGRLRVRKGYEKFNDTALAGSPTQLYHFRSMSDPDVNHVLCIADDNWYVAEAVGAHTQISTEDATAPRPILEYGDRLFFGTDGSEEADIGFRWTDNASIGTGTSYRVGIERPALAPSVSTIAPRGRTNAVTDFIQMNRTDKREIAFRYDTGAADETVDGIYIKPSVTNVNTLGAWHLEIETDNGGEPSGTIVSDEARTTPILVSHFSIYGTFSWKRFLFQGKIPLDANTTYWFRVVGDEAYYDGMVLVWPPDAGDLVALLGTDAAPYTYSASMWLDTTGPADAWVASTREASFYLGGLDYNVSYGYVITYFNDTYQIESRPSEESRVDLTFEEQFQLNPYPAPADPQITHVRLYRREMTSVEDLEATITDAFKLVGQLVSPATLDDDTSTEWLGAELQTQDHYLFDDFEEEGESVRTAALQPNVATVWKDRIWFAEANANILYMSKILEGNGATGLIGDAIPDFFPLENRLEMPVPSGIIGLRTLSDDLLAVYFRDESIWVIWGANEVSNPPFDIRIDDKTPANGLVGTMALDRIEGRHIIMTRDGLYAFHPNGTLEFLSETNQSILDAIETTNLESSVVTVYGNEIWCLIDSDNDGDLETILILDMQRDIQSRQLHDRAWRTYDFGANLNDIIVRKSGGDFRTLLAAAAESNYILELNTGTEDDGGSITAEVETHDLIAPTKARIYQIDIDAFYPGNAPTYEGTLTDHNGDTQSFTLTPESSNDIRKHRVGCSLKAPVSVRALLAMDSEGEDELRSLVVSHTGE